MPLTIRNFTSTPLTLQLVEYYELPSGDSKKQPSHDRLGELAKSYSKEDVNVRFEPFHTQRSPIAMAKGKADALRLTFTGEGDGKWRIDVPTKPGNATRLTRLGQSMKNFFCLYFVHSSFLALFEGRNLDKWMRDHPDDTPLSAISIPGTHNSPTCHPALPSVRCQAVSPKEQLEHGVRFFDVRVQVDDPNNKNSDELTLVHSAFPISLTGSKKFDELYKDIKEFLKKNASETVILSLKREGIGNATDADLAHRLHSHYVNPREWYSGSHVPTLGEARGKIILFRRFSLGERLQGELKGSWGINAQSWEDNTPNHKFGHLEVQDFYEVLDTKNIEKKTKFVCDHCDRAGAKITPKVAGQGNSPLFINFLSASNFWKPGCWPDKIAAKINPAVTEHLCTKHRTGDREEKGDGGTGVLVCDWVGEDGNWDLVKVIVGMNGKLLAKRDDRLRPGGRE